MTSEFRDRMMSQPSTALRRPQPAGPPSTALARRVQSPSSRPLLHEPFQRCVDRLARWTASWHGQGRSWWGNRCDLRLLSRRLGWRSTLGLDTQAWRRLGALAEAGGGAPGREPARARPAAAGSGFSGSLVFDGGRDHWRRRRFRPRLDRNAFGTGFRGGGSNAVETTPPLRPQAQGSGLHEQAFPGSHQRLIERRVASPRPTRSV